ncbi:hypothetical protein BCR34DRAFT_199035 [Clohesyomyces aquaticus]|uniref:Uncharacterized protein n=1 Tax=Clohesyomyces aquaticus TaxID=1231657 RepID=A0A1Y1ZY20_9PLEO|nr:hypothetical protein BCR34DRAFT_199035 [Clohesyomyces aquaticus]
MQIVHECWPLSQANNIRQRLQSACSVQHQAASGAALIEWPDDRGTVNASSVRLNLHLLEALSMSARIREKKKQSPGVTAARSMSRLSWNLTRGYWLSRACLPCSLYFKILLGSAYAANALSSLVLREVSPKNKRRRDVFSFRKKWHDLLSGIVSHLQRRMPLIARWRGRRFNSSQGPYSSTGSTPALVPAVFSKYHLVLRPPSASEHTTE